MTLTALNASPAKLLAAVVNAYTGEDTVSHLTHSWAELWGAYYSAAVGGSAHPEKRIGVPAMMAAIANEIGGSASHLTMSPAEIMAVIANAAGADPAVSHLTSSFAELLAVVANTDPTPPDLALIAKYGGALYDFSRTDLTFQDAAGTTLADDATEPVALALDSGQFGGRTLAEVVAGQPELLTNGGFDTNTTGWEAVQAATLSSVGGELVVTAGGTAFPQARQLFSTTALDLYFARVTARRGTHVTGAATLASERGSDAAVINSLATSQTTSTSPTQLQQFFTPPSGQTQSYIALINTSDGTTGHTNIFDNASCKRIPGYHAIQSGSTSLRGVRQADGSIKPDGIDDNLLTSLLSTTSMFFAAAIKCGTKPASGVATLIGGPIGTARGYFGRNASGQLCAGVGSDGVTTIVGGGDLDGLSGVAMLNINASGKVDLEWMPKGGALESIYSQPINGAVGIGTALRLWATNAGGTAANYNGDYHYEDVISLVSVPASEREALAAYLNNTRIP